jgi:hypothetical protein
METIRIIYQHLVALPRGGGIRTGIAAAAAKIEMATAFQELEDVWVAFISEADSHSEKLKGEEFLRDVQALNREYKRMHNVD